ncbi:MAG: type II toxin-antitoxin system VapC family toxin [Okeania sp. SIO3C4]|nr:type II toxin-antitoxin system VapC family toxin [Okeania sp. SIO3C4]
MKRIFLDTSYLQALADERDDLHHKAITVSESNDVYVGITTEMVLTELLNALSNRGEYLRQVAIDIVETLRADPNIEIIPQTSKQFEKAMKFYQQRLDKGYSLTDCASMLVMKEESLWEIMTYDRHFMQEGFNALLRDD